MLLNQKVKSRINKLYHTTKSRAKDKGLAHDIDTDYLEALYIGCQGFCPFTKIKLEVETGSIDVRNPRGMSIDRIDSKLGYIRGNVRIVCTFYNNAKGAWSDEFLVEMSKRIVETELEGQSGASQFDKFFEYS